ncbi:MAG: hypothetical protein WKG03_00755 [Telluria sp.]
MTIRIQAEISGYGGPAVNVLGALDPESGLLIVARELKLGERLDDVLVVSNDPRAERRDRLFSEDDLQDAIRLFFRAQSTGMIELLPTVSKFEPAHKIESNGIDENGTKYRLSPDITNGNIAVLALTKLADATYRAQSATDFAEEMASLFLSI